ncbi:MAG: hypothetical protein ACTSPD_13925 [Promethearchaeota archaeon]
MKCYFCGIDDEELNGYQEEILECFNCGRSMCPYDSGSSEKIVGDFRDSFCRYCIEIRDWKTFPIKINKIKCWIEELGDIIASVPRLTKAEIIDKISNIKRQLESVLPEVYIENDD